MRRLTSAPSATASSCPGGIHENAETICHDGVRRGPRRKGIRLHDGEGGGAVPECTHLPLPGAAGRQFRRGTAGERRLPRPSLRSEQLVKVFVFDETQQPLSDNVLRFFTFLKRKARWITAGELAREGVQKAIEELAEDLKTDQAGKGMKVLFAMDLIGGRPVRLVRGDFDRMTVYGDDPAAMIERMVRRGARDFHVIDLDGARTGSVAHRDLIGAIRGRVAGYLEVGGGIRTEEDIASYTALGVDGVIVGTRALTDPAFFEGLSAFRNIVLGLDMYEGKLMVKGWKEAALRRHWSRRSTTPGGWASRPSSARTSPGRHAHRARLRGPQKT